MTKESEKLLRELYEGLSPEDKIRVSLKLHTIMCKILINALSKKEVKND